MSILRGHATFILAAIWRNATPSFASGARASAKSQSKSKIANRKSKIERAV